MLINITTSIEWDETVDSEASGEVEAHEFATTPLVSDRDRKKPDRKPPLVTTMPLRETTVVDIATEAYSDTTKQVTMTPHVVVVPPKETTSYHLKPAGIPVSRVTLASHT